MLLLKSSNMFTVSLVLWPNTLLKVFIGNSGGAHPSVVNFALLYIQPKAILHHVNELWVPEETKAFEYQEITQRIFHDVHGPPLHSTVIVRLAHL